MDGVSLRLVSALPRLDGGGAALPKSVSVALRRIPRLRPPKPPVGLAAAAEPPEEAAKPGPGTAGATSALLPPPAATFSSKMAILLLTGDWSHAAALSLVPSFNRAKIVFSVKDEQSIEAKYVYFLA